jgi:ACS family D-galactonate transporter-like MFS transporter
MSVSAARPIGEGASGGFLAGIRTRQLDSYPDTAPRMAYLGLTVLITVALYYELYVGGSVSTLQLADIHHLDFTFYVRLLAFGNLIGAFGSLFAGITDRLGRCNIVVGGLLLTGILTLWVLPAMTNRWGFGIAGFAVGLVEGICLVATPALIRDFSPQVGRGAAMGFWTMGPVLGSLVVAVVGSITIKGTPAPSFWGHEYVICGVVGLVVFALAFVFLRELSPGLRDQLMVTTRDRALVEMRAKGLDIESSLKNPFRQLVKPDIVISAFAISVFLLIYYTAVGFGTIYFQTIFRFSLSSANHIADWNWGVNAAALVVIGILSDRFRVRKPFMILGGVFAAVMMVLYLSQAGHSASFLHLAVLVSLLALGLGLAYTPWMASFTETVEARNPALTATGLAIWGWILRVIVFASFLVLPAVINTVTPLVDFGVNTAGYSTQLNFAAAHPTLVAGVSNPANRAQLANLTKLASSPATAGQLKAVQANSANLATLQKYAPEVTAISKNPTLFTRLAAAPTDKALQAQAVAALGGGSKGISELATLAAHQTAIRSALTFAASNPSVVGFAKANASTLTWAVTHPALIAQATRYKAQLTALSKVPKSVLAYAGAHGAKAAAAARKSPGQWKTWYWICFAGMIVFLISTPLMKGRWSPKAAKADEEAHEAMVQAELARLNA